MNKHQFLRFGTRSIPSSCILGFEPVDSLAHWGPGVRDSYILHFVISGKGFLNGLPVEAQQGFVIRPGQLHEYHASLQDGWNYFYVIFSDSQAESFLKEYGIFPHVDLFSFVLPEHFIPLYASFLARPEPAPENDYGLSLLLMLMSSILQKHPPALQDRGQAHVRQAMEYIRLHYHQKLSMSMIAQAVFLDEGYLYNLFIRHLGQSPKTYINQLRLEKSCELLKRTDLLVTEIGRSVGYEDVLQFSKFFKTHMGLSPTQYRKKS